MAEGSQQFCESGSRRKNSSKRCTQ